MNAYALVIGNADYTLSKHKLRNAVNDAEDISKKLFDLGFIVKTSTNCTTEEFDKQQTEFGNQLKNFDVGLFFFAGHGLQIDNENYLTAIDTPFTDSITVKHKAIKLNEILDRMQNENTKIKILILDTCRDNPLPGFRGNHEEGLAPIQAPKGTIIAFSTSPGEKARDSGTTQMSRNSIYTESLLNHIDDVNIPIEEFFKRVRTSVFTLSNGTQTSWEHTCLIGDFHFNSGKLRHVVSLPYKDEHIADKNLKSTDSEMDKVIQKLKSYNFYEQKAGFSQLLKIPVNTLDDSVLFLLGRNILQTATGGEFTAKDIINNLEHWLLKYSKGNENHVLNGILFEIYFNSEGKFRQKDFKNNFITEIFALNKNEKYKASFQFIREQLMPFQAFLYYIPDVVPITLPIELELEAYEAHLKSSGKVVTHIRHSLISVKYHGQEVVELPKISREIEIEIEMEHDGYYTLTLISYDEFLKKFCKLLCLPEPLLKISMNVDSKDVKMVRIPNRLILIPKNYNHQGGKILKIFKV